MSYGSYYGYGYGNNQQVYSQVLGILSTYWLISVAIAVFSIVCMWKLFVKAGEEGWKCLIPFYNFYTETKIVDYTRFFWFSLFGGLGLGVVAGIVVGIAASSNGSNGAAPAVVVVGIISLIFAIVMLVMAIKFNIKLAHAFGKSGAFVVGLILLPVIFVAILAFGDAQYQLGGKASATQN